MSAVPAGTLISSSLVARNCRSTLERREKSGMFRRSSTLIVTDRSFVWTRWYHAPHSRYAVRAVLRCPRRGERASRGLRGGAVDSGGARFDFQGRACLARVPRAPRAAVRDHPARYQRGGGLVARDALFDPTVFTRCHRRSLSIRAVHWPADARVLPRLAQPISQHDGLVGWPLVARARLPWYWMSGRPSPSTVRSTRA